MNRFAVVTCVAGALTAQTVAPTLPSPILKFEKERYVGSVAKVPGASRTWLEAYARLPEGEPQPLQTKLVLFSDSLAYFELEVLGPVSKRATCIYVLHKATVGGVDQSSGESNCVNLSSTKEEWIDVTSLPIREGDSTIEGKAGRDVKEVRVFVNYRGSAEKARATFLTATRLGSAPDPEREQLLYKMGSAQVLNVEALIHEKLESKKRDTAKRQAATPPGKSAKAAPGDPERETESIWLSPDEISATECLADEPAQQFDVAVKDGSFKGAYPRPLSLGHCVVVRGKGPDGTLFGTPKPVYVQSLVQDWGRLRGTFYLGIAVARTNGNFGQTDPYLGFYVDANLFNRLQYSECKDRDSACNERARRFELRRFRFAGHFFGEGRLTQSTLPAISGSGSGTKQAQTMFFQSGTYFPLSFKGWDFVRLGQTYSFFAAPLGKFGVQVPDGGVLLARTSTIFPGEVTPLGRPVAADADNKDTRIKDVAAFYGYGTRLGLFRYEMMGAASRNRQVAPDLLAYIDFTVGHNGVFRTEKLVAETPATASPLRPATKGFIYVADPRFSMEARLKLPYIPVQVGIDYNVSTRGVERSPADFRFIFATRVDAAAALGKIFASGK